MKDSVGDIELREGGRPRGKTKLILISVLVLLIAAIVVLSAAPKAPEPSGGKAVSAAVPVRTIAVTATNMPEVAVYAAHVEANRTVSLSVEQAGRVIWVGAEKGQLVTNGQALLTIDSRAQTAAVMRAEAAYRQTTSNLRRTVELRKTGAVSENDFEGIEALAKIAEANFIQAGLDLEHCTLVSPLSGVLEDRGVEVGELVAPGMKAFKVVEVDPVKAVVDLPERDVFALKAGREVTFNVDALDGAAFTGRVSFVAAAADPRSNTFRVEVLTANPGRSLKPGVIVRIPFTRRIIPDAVAVPIEALIPEKGLHLAYVVDKGAAVQRSVKLSGMVNNQAIVAEGLRPGERLVVEGQRMLADGTPVSESP